MENSCCSRRCSKKSDAVSLFKMLAVKDSQIPGHLLSLAVQLPSVVILGSGVCFGS